MEIISLLPSIKETIWGGRTLIDEYGFETDKDNAAEAWLLSCHKDGPCFVLNGEYAGRTLSEVVAIEGRSILGTRNESRPDFPILIKMIDAADKLSVQVHPDDEYARREEHENGKTEAWLVLAAKEGARLVYGVNREISRDEFEKSIEKGELAEHLNFVPVKAGDVAFIPAGTLHAIGAGILIAEVQQSSNTTYRVFDYNRRDKNNNLRELHVKKASDVVELKKPEKDFSPEGRPEKTGDAVKTYLTGCEYFKMTSVKLDGEYLDFADGGSFVSLLVLDGDGEISCEDTVLKLKKGTSVFIPAGKGDFRVKGKLSLLETRT